MKKLIWPTLLLLTLNAQVSHAERGDRNKPINVEANKLTIDDEQHVQILEGDVLLTQGTLNIRASKMVITEDAQGFQRGVASGGTGGRAYFRQKREGKQDYIEGEGERIEYDTRTEVAELFNKAWVKSGHDLIKGGYIRYDSLSEKYQASAQPATSTVFNQPTPGNAEQQATNRVRAVLQPQSKKHPDASGEPENSLMLRGSTQLRNP
jgi:lipopolysaccharide export system protein LptA